MTLPPMSRPDRASARARRVQCWPSHPPDNISRANVAHCLDLEHQPAPKETARPLRLRVQPSSFFAWSVPCLFLALQPGRAYGANRSSAPGSESCSPRAARVSSARKHKYQPFPGPRLLWRCTVASVLWVCGHISKTPRRQRDVELIAAPGPLERRSHGTGSTRSSSRSSCHCHITLGRGLSAWRRRTGS